VAHLCNRTILAQATDRRVAGAFVCFETEWRNPMHCESEQYRFARIDGLIITLARLQQRFEDRAVNLKEMEAAVIEQLANDSLCAPWRTSETERAGCRAGMRLAAIQFLSQYQEVLRNLPLDGPAQAPSLVAHWGLCHV
jgi:hypothetical protein